MKKSIILLLTVFNGLNTFSQYEQNNKPKINSVGVGTITAFPNAAQITIEFQHIKPTLREAVNENQKTTDQVINIVKKYIVDSSEIKTSLISTSKATRWDQKLSKDIFIGFQSNQKLILILI